MTFQNDLQSLIADIDSVLPKAGSRLFRPRPVDLDQQRRVLERVRSYLASLERQSVTPSQNPSTLTPTDREAVGQIAQAVIAQMDTKLADWIRQEQTELEALRQQRESLLREIRQLEVQRQQIISDFLQVLMDRCSENLQQQIAQIWENLETQFVHNQSRGNQNIETAGLSNKYPSIKQPEGLEQLTQLQQQSDQLLMTLDSTFRTVFETLERDLQGYHESLSQGLERMHSLGQQGEAKFIAYVNGLAQQLGQPIPIASVTAQTFPQSSETTANKPNLGTAPPTPSPAPTPTSEQFPSAEMEIPPIPRELASSSSSEPSAKSEIEQVEESEIDTLLEIVLSEESERPQGSDTQVDLEEIPTAVREELDNGDKSSDTSIDLIEGDASQQAPRESIASSMPDQQASELLVPEEDPPAVAQVDLSAPASLEESPFQELADLSVELPRSDSPSNSQTVSLSEEELFEDATPGANEPREVEPVRASVSTADTSHRKEEEPQGVETIRLLTDLLKPGFWSGEETSKDIWYLGIDFGTTGLAAVLLNAKVSQQYPIYWSGAREGIGESSFLLPAAAYCTQMVEQESQFPSSSFVIGAVASDAAKQQTGIFLENFKPYLSLAVPYYCPEQHQWEPKLQGSGQQLVSLYLVQQALQALLATLTPMSDESVLGLKVEAVGLSQESLRKALGQLEGVVLSCPALWGGTYRFNLREALLRAGLVKDPGQIFFVEEAIATLLARLPIDGGLVTETGQDSTQSPITTLVINAGATTTELALVDLPNNLQKLTHGDFNLRSFAYGGNALDQDILFQLIYPQWVSQLQPSLPNLDMELPRAGEPDQERRDRAGLRLQSYPIGRSFLEAAKLVKLILQQREEFTSQLGNQQWGVKRQDLDLMVIHPFIQQLNQQVNLLLGEAGKSEQEIGQVICSGGTTLAVWRSLSPWLRETFPNATLIQDTGEDYMSTVAAGLARLPLFPLILDRPRHQYSDYFLLIELLETIPNKSFSIEELMQLLRRRGINTSVCSDRLIGLLNGKLPPSLVPSSTTAANWLSEASQQNLDCQAIAAYPLFSQEENGCYRPNLKQCERLRQYLAAVLSGTEQKLTEPLIVSLRQSLVISN